VSRWFCTRRGECDGVTLGDICCRHFTRRIQDRIGKGADVRVDALEVAQNVEMKRGCFQRLRPALAQSFKVPLCRRQLVFRNSVFSEISFRASLRSPDMNTPNAILRLSRTRLWNAVSSAPPSVEN
jgi:hypothetical protein